MEVIQWDGKTITAPGIYAGVPLLDYHSADICDAPSISSSGLRKIHDMSAAHYWAHSPYNKERDPDDDPEESRALIVGRAAHHLFLGQREFAKEYVTRPETVDGEAWHGNRKACKAWLDKAAKDKLTVLKPEEATTILRMAKALAREPLMQAGILHGRRELSFFWKRGKFWLKARPDATPNDSADFSDYKSTVSVEAEAIIRTINDFGYHMQGAMIGMGCAALMNMPMHSFNLVFQEKKAPYCVRVVSLRAADLKRGEDECLLSLQVFERGLTTGKWPGPAGAQSEAHYLGLSEWATKARDVRNKQIAQELKDA